MDPCALMFTAALFTVVKRWKLLKCPLMDKRINGMWFIHTTGVLFSPQKE